MDERLLRRWAASEAQALGWGGASAVTQATGISRTTIRSGIAELHRSTPDSSPGRIRKPGAGRPRLSERNPRPLDDLHALLEPATRGDPKAPLLWTSKSTRNLADELVDLGHEVSHDTIGRLLEGIGYSLQANRKTLEGKDHPDRDAQFEYINQQVRAFQKAGQPVVSVDAKKKELIGNFRNPGREWHRRGESEEVCAKDFRDKQLGKAIPEASRSLRSLGVRPIRSLEASGSQSLAKPPKPRGQTDLEVFPQKLPKPRGQTDLEVFPKPRGQTDLRSLGVRPI